MRMLKVYGGDYAAIEFQDHFSGRKISELIENFSEVEAEAETLQDTVNPKPEYQTELMSIMANSCTVKFFNY